MGDQQAEIPPSPAGTVPAAVVSEPLLALQSQLQSLEQQLQRVEQALHESEGRFTLVTDGVNHGSWDWDLRRNTIRLSPRLSDLLGVGSAVSVLPVRAYMARIAAGDRERLRESLRTYLASPMQHPWEGEYRIQRGDGSWGWFVSRGVAVRDAAGAVVGLVGAVNDVSEQRTAEEQLRRSETLYRTLAEKFPKGAVLLFDHDLRYVLADGQGMAEIGLSSADLVGKTIWEAFSPATAAALEPYYRATLAGESPSVTLDYLNHIYEAHLCPIDDERGATALGMAVVLDVTERQQSERAVRESEAKFRTLAETMAAAIFIFQGSDLNYVNQTAAAITEYAPEELCRMRFWDLIDPEFRALVRTRGLARQAGEGVPARYEVKIRTKSGGERWVDFTAGVIQYEGRPAVLGTAFDITERKRTEEALRRREAELAHVTRVSTMGEMAAALAHELNQPLTAIVSFAKGCVHRVRAGTAPAQDLIDALEQVAQQGVRAGEIIRRLRHFVRKGESRREVTDLNAVVGEAVSLVEPEARERGIALRLVLAPGLPPVEADEIQIEQVVLNLVRNACEAMQSGSCAAPEMTIATTERDGFLEVMVADRGEGIAPEALEKIFDAFYSTRANGMGMGLSISRSIVRAHGGELWASQNAGGDTVFRFTLPVRASFRSGQGSQD